MTAPQTMARVEETMAVRGIGKFLGLIPVLKKSPQRTVWLSYDQEADTLYVNFKKPSYATDSNLTDEDVIVRYEGDTIVGLTILHASQR
jgi:uncharacterized protein YuzE